MVGGNGHLRELHAVLQRLVASLCVLAAFEVCAAEPLPLTHVRNGAEREWAEFPESPARGEWEWRFTAQPSDKPRTLRLRQQDVKQAWRVTLNDKPLGELVRDENDLVAHFTVPADAVRDGENQLRIAPAGKQPVDDIRVGEAELVALPPRDWLGQCEVEVAVTDEDSKSPLPSRLTLVNEAGALHPFVIEPSKEYAARVGTLYTSTGNAKFHVPPGKYTLYAGRGFEYSLAQVDITAQPGETAKHALTIRREVDTAGYVACDPHLHTLTHSGHGDATLAERMVTLAGEGIELPIACDHNVHVDYEAAAAAASVRQYFTPVVGNEVTTSVGHFNVFPVSTSQAPADHKLKTWPEIFDSIGKSPTVKIVILNHARDLHSGVRPFGPKLHNGAVAENLRGWPVGYNAMEIINSGATQTAPLELTRDWLALLNRGERITPVGSSDSHDVSRHFAGQGRTYVRCDDADVSKIDVAAAIESFAAGRVLVSYGLLAELKVNGKGSGDILSAEDEVTAAIRVSGPQWVAAERVQLYVNGRLAREEQIEPRAGLPRGVQWQAEWQLPQPRQDEHWAVVALGQPVIEPYWKTAKPYQPTSPVWTSPTFACSGAVFVDADGDGKWTSPRGYATTAFEKSKGDVAQLVTLLAERDAATATHAAHLAHVANPSTSPDDLLAGVRNAAPQVKAGFGEYVRAWRETELAKAE